MEKTFKLLAKATLHREITQGGNGPGHEITQERNTAHGVYTGCWMDGHASRQLRLPEKTNLIFLLLMNLDNLI